VLPTHRRGRHPYAAHSGAHVYHYGWVRSAEKMAEKNHRISMQLEKLFGWDLSKKHYLPIK
jgi:hypothetical protein